MRVTSSSVGQGLSSTSLGLALVPVMCYPARVICNFMLAVWIHVPPGHRMWPCLPGSVSVFRMNGRF